MMRFTTTVFLILVFACMGLAAEAQQTYSIWPSSDAPITVDGGSTSATTVGVRFESSIPGVITGLRFYKATTNTGTHIGTLYDEYGNVLAQATFTGETGSGWQQVNFSAPIPIAMGSPYVATYLAPNGHYADDSGYFNSGNSEQANDPLIALENSTTNPYFEAANGIYNVGSAPTMPQTTNASDNYWVDVVFVAAAGYANSLWSRTSIVPAHTDSYDPNSTNCGVRFQTAVPGFISGIMFYKGLDGLNAGTHIGSVYSITGSGSDYDNDTLLEQTTFTNETANGWQEQNFATPIPVTAGANYVASYLAPKGHYSDTSEYFETSTYSDESLLAPYTGLVGANGLYAYSTSAVFPTSTSSAANYFVDVVFDPLSATLSSLWDKSTTPTNADASDTNSTNVGVSFETNGPGLVEGIMFYKGTTNTGTHVGSLYSASGSLLAQATFTGETASGWQTVSFSSPVLIQPNTPYIASYLAPNGHYAYNSDYFTANYANGDIMAPESVSGAGNGLYTYSSSPACPTDTYDSDNYWVDVVFDPIVQQAPYIPTNLGPPSITGTPSVPIIPYQIAATNSPSSYGYTGTMAPGLSLNTATGQITGTLTTTGSWTIGVTATNSAGTATGSLKIYSGNFGAGGYPTAATTGPTSTPTAALSGNIVVNSAWLTANSGQSWLTSSTTGGVTTYTISGVTLNGSLDIEASNITVQNCVINTTNSWAIAIGATGDTTATGTQIEYCRIVEVFGAGPDYGGEDYGMSDSSSGTLDVGYCDFSNLGDTIEASYGDIHDCFIHDTQDHDGLHSDCIICAVGAPHGITINHNTLFNSSTWSSQLNPRVQPACASMAVYLDAAAQSSPQVVETITNNWIAGGSDSIHCGGNTSYGDLVENNEFSQILFIDCGFNGIDEYTSQFKSPYGSDASGGAGTNDNIWLNNTWADDLSGGAAAGSPAGP